MASKFHSNRLDQFGSFSFSRSNRRKTTKARRTQVIKVSKLIMKKGLSETDAKIAKVILELGHPEDYNNDLFIPNPSPFAGRTKFIYHARPTV